jgi:hypothetical protein
LAAGVTDTLVSVLACGNGRAGFVPVCPGDARTRNSSSRENTIHPGKSQDNRTSLNFYQASLDWIFLVMEKTEIRNSPAIPVPSAKAGAWNRWISIT